MREDLGDVLIFKCLSELTYFFSAPKFEEAVLSLVLYEPAVVSDPAML